MTYFFHTDTPPIDIYTLSLHDALPILLKNFFLWQNRLRFLILLFITPFRKKQKSMQFLTHFMKKVFKYMVFMARAIDRKSTRLNSSHVRISYAVFCLKKKKK